MRPVRWRDGESMTHGSPWVQTPCCPDLTLDPHTDLTLDPHPDLTLDPHMRQPQNYHQLL